MCISEMHRQWQWQRQQESKAAAAATALTTITATAAAQIVSSMNKTTTFHMKCVRGRSEIEFQCERKKY